MMKNKLMFAMLLGFGGLSQVVKAKMMLLDDAEKNLREQGREVMRLRQPLHKLWLNKHQTWVQEWRECQKNVEGRSQAQQHAYLEEISSRFPEDGPGLQKIDAILSKIRSNRERIDENRRRILNLDRLIAKTVTPANAFTPGVNSLIETREKLTCINIEPLNF